jgi:DNA-binding CsgD family transcriptional regulator
MGEASRTEARIKQLCCLGLGGEVVMPALLKELHALIPSYGNQFMWADDEQQLRNMYGENPDTAQFAPVYIAEFYNRGERLIGGFTNAVRHEHGVMSRDQTLTVDKASFYRSDLYNLLLRPLGYDDFLRLTIREGDKPLGLVGLFRQPGDAPFSPKEKRTLAMLEPFIAHALTPQRACGVPLVDSGESGLIIADAAGRLVYLSPEGRRLLFLATHPQVTCGTANPAAPPVLPTPMARICRHLTAIFAGEDEGAAPVHQHTNNWGGFTFRAYRLDASDASPASLVGITVTRQEPLPLKLIHQMQKLPLSGRQAEVCLLMASGLSYSAIAERLHISAHTAIAHSRSIYTALDVSNRAELVNKLLAA